MLEELTGKSNDDAAKDVSGGGAERSCSIEQVRVITQERFGRDFTDEQAQALLEKYGGDLTDEHLDGVAGGII